MSEKYEQQKMKKMSDLLSYMHYFKKSQTKHDDVMTGKLPAFSGGFSLQSGVGALFLCC